MRKKLNILIPIDFSKASINAIKFGVEIAKKSRINVHVLHAFRLIDHQEFIDNHQALDLSKKLKHTLSNQLSELKKSYFDANQIDSNFGLQIGFPEDVINSFIENNIIDVVIMGLTGEGNNPALFGSTISSVIASNTVSVIALKKDVSNLDVTEDFLFSFFEHNANEVSSLSDDSTVSIGSKDFNKVKNSITESEQIRKAIGPIFIYSST